MFNHLWEAWFSKVKSIDTVCEYDRPTTLLDAHKFMETEDWVCIKKKQSTYDSDSTDSSDSEFLRKPTLATCEHVYESDTTDADSGFLYEQNGWSSDSEVDILDVNESLGHLNDRFNTVSITGTPSALIECVSTTDDRSKAETTGLDVNTKEFKLHKLEQFMSRATILNQIINKASEIITVVRNLFYDLCYYVNSKDRKNYKYEAYIETNSSALEELVKLRLETMKLKIRSVAANIERLINISFELQRLPKHDQPTKQERVDESLNILEQVESVIYNKEIELHNIFIRLELLRDYLHQ